MLRIQGLFDNFPHGKYSHGTPLNELPQDAQATLLAYNYVYEDSGAATLNGVIADTAPDPQPPDLSLLDLTVKDLKTQLQEIHDLPLVESLLEHEGSNGKKRKLAIKHLRARIEALSGSN